MSNQDNEKNKRLHETIGALETGDAIPAAPSPGANAEEVAAGYFDPNDIRERWAQLYNRCTFTSDPHAVPYTRYVTVDTATFDEFAHDFAALLESFRAETLEQAIHICEYAARGTVEKMSRGDKSETWKIIAQNSVEQYESIVKRIRDLRADPNWLARQIAEAQIAELDALETVMDEAGMLAEWGSVAQIRYKNRRRAALAATKSQLTEGK